MSAARSKPNHPGKFDLSKQMNNVIVTEVIEAAWIEADKGLVPSRKCINLVAMGGAIIATIGIMNGHSIGIIDFHDGGMRVKAIYGTEKGWSTEMCRRAIVATVYAEFGRLGPRIKIVLE